MKQKLNNYLKRVLFLLCTFFLLTNCEKDDTITLQNNSSLPNYSLKKISLQELQQKKERQQILQKLSPKFEVNKSKKTTHSKIDANDGSITLLTDKIIQVTTDSTLTYSFLLKTPTDPSSEFENFVLEIKHDSLINYYLLKYKTATNNANFPYLTTIQTVDKNLFDSSFILTEVNNRMESVTSGDCNYLFEVIEYCCGEEDWVLVDIICGGGGSYSGSGNSGSENQEDEIINIGAGGGGVTNPNPDNGNEGGLDPSPLGVNEPKDKYNCDFFNKLATNQPIKDLINIYKQNTGLPTEVGICLSEQEDGSYNATVGTVPDEEYAVQFNLASGFTLDIMIHTHNTGGLSIFSPQDFEQIYQLMINNNITVNNPFVSILITEDDVYAFTFTNPQTFINFGNFWLNDPIKFEWFKDRFFTKKNDSGKKHVTYGINGNNDNATNELHFLEMINHQNMGIMVHKAIDDLTEWSLLKINPITNNVQPTPCN